MEEGVGVIINRPTEMSTAVDVGEKNWKNKKHKIQFCNTKFVSLSISFQTLFVDLKSNSALI